jgi:ribosomal protein S27AE
MFMVENKGIKKDSTEKPTCPKCNKNGFVRKHDTRGGVKRYRCMNPKCKYVFSVSPPKLEEPTKINIEQLRKEFDIIYVWLSDYQTLSKTARNLDTTNYHVKKVIKVYFRDFFYEDETEKSYSEVRKELRNDRYKNDKEFGSGEWLKTIWRLYFPKSTPFLFGLSENEFKEEIEKKYDIKITIKKAPPMKAPVTETLEKDATQLLKEYKILLDWLAIGGHNLYHVANKNGTRYKEIEEIIKGRFKVEFGVNDNRIRELRRYIKKKQSEIEIKDSRVYGYEYCCEQFKLALFDPKSDFYNGVYRPKEEILKEYELKELHL